MGAISNKSKEMIYTIDKGTSSNTVISFLRHFATQVDQIESIVFVLDNCSSHTSEVTMAKFSELAITTCFMPTYSSPLNPVEHVWALLKKQWKDKLAEENGFILDH